jgi:uncharacterized protein (TIGR02246 family)
MLARTPQEAVAQLDDAFNRGDIEAVLDFYEDEAVMVTQPGRIAKGKAELRRAFEVILGSGGSAKQEKTHVIEAGDVALFLSRWTLSAQAPDGTRIRNQFFATSVFRKGADGRWRLVIDNAFGPALVQE